MFTRIVYLHACHSQRWIHASDDLQFRRTRDEIADPGKVQITTTLNGQVMQSPCTDDLIYGLPQLIEYYSQFYRFRPGDIVATGSPSGVGFGRKPQVFMKPGDVVAVTVKEIGTLSNPIAEEEI